MRSPNTKIRSGIQMSKKGFADVRRESAGDDRHARPNIILIYADDLGYGDVSCHGATKVRTPNIDSLAHEGKWFTDSHSASAVCTPSRYCLLTGEYAWRVGNWGPAFHKDGLLIDPSKMTIARLLKNHGYSTACIGKWHLGFGEKTPDWNGELNPGPLEIGNRGARRSRNSEYLWADPRRN